MATVYQLLESIAEALVVLRSDPQTSRCLKAYIDRHGDGGAEFDVLDRIEGDLWDLVAFIEEA